MAVMGGEPNETRQQGQAPGATRGQISQAHTTRPTVQPQDPIQEVRTGRPRARTQASWKGCGGPNATTV